jgi:hypothetical protein
MVVPSTAADTAGYPCWHRVPSATTVTEVAALGRLTVPVRLVPGWVSRTAWPPLADRLATTPAPAGSAIASA